jgi:hypothetical protein
MTEDPKRSETLDEDGPIAAALGRHEATALGALLVFAALFRALRWSATAVLFNDGPVFLTLAQAMADGEWARALSHEYHPLYPALTAAARAVIGDWELAAVVVNVIGGTAAVGCLYGFARAAFGRTPGFVAAALLAVHPHAIEFSGDVQSEGLYLGLFLGAVWALWLVLRRESHAAAPVAGLLCGLAYLTRPEGIGLLAVGGLLTAWYALRRSWSLRRAATLGTLLFLSTACVAGPYLAWLRVDSGEWSLTQKKSIGWVAGLSGPPARYAPSEQAEASPDPASGLESTTEAQKAASEKRATPSRGRRYGDALVDLIRTDLRALRIELFAILLAGGMVAGWRRPTQRGVFVLLIIGLYGLLFYALASNLGYVSSRHVLPPLTVAFGHVGAALLALAGVFSASRRRVALALIFLLVAGLGLSKSLRPDRTDSVAERTGAEWLRAQDLPPGGVAARRRRIAYYAGAHHVRIPETPYKDAIGGMRKRGADYLIVNAEEIGDTPWLEEALPTRARLLHREEANGVSAFVYRLLPKGESPAESEPALP